MTNLHENVLDPMIEPVTIWIPGGHAPDRESFDESLWKCPKNLKIFIICMNVNFIVLKDMMERDCPVIVLIKSVWDQLLKIV